MRQPLIEARGVLAIVAVVLDGHELLNIFLWQLKFTGPTEDDTFVSRRRLQARDNLVDHLVASALMAVARGIGDLQENRAVSFERTPTPTVADILPVL